MIFFVVRSGASAAMSVVAQDITGLGIPLGTLTPAGLLAVVILLIVVGRLVPRRTMEDVIHDRNEWRAAHRISETARQTQAENLAQLVEAFEGLDAFIRALPSGAAAASRSDDDARR